MTTESSHRSETTEADHDGEAYRVTLDRDACEGIFACLVRDDRFREAADGLAAIEGAGPAGKPTNADGESHGTVVARFEDDRLADAERAAAACPVDAIEVEVPENDTIEVVADE
jgi:ferredoxin